jgi:hypothetical protein
VPLFFGINPFAYVHNEQSNQEVADLFILIKHREIEPEFSTGEPLEYWRDSFRTLGLTLPDWLDKYMSKEELKLFKKKQKLKEIASKITPEIKEKRIKEFTKSMEETKAFLERKKMNPYSFSSLGTYLTLDSWSWKDGLLLLAGGDPDYADINWEGYDNYMGVHIDQPKVNDMGFLDCRWGDADTPSSYELGDNEDYFRGDEMVERKIEHLGLIESRLRRIYQQWINALVPHEARNMPSYYIDWAMSKGIHIEWFDWAVKEGFYKNNRKPADSELSSRKYDSMLKIIHALAHNGYKYPNHGALKEMIDDFERNGNGVSEKTLKRYLDEFDKL